MAGDDDRVFNGGTVRWTHEMPSSGAQNDYWRVGDVLVGGADNKYWDGIVERARSTYGDPGIHYASAWRVNQPKYGEGLTQYNHGGGRDDRVLVYGDGSPVPSSGEVTWKAGDGRRWTAQPDGSYQVFGSTDAKDHVQPDFYRRSPDGKLVAYKDGQPIFAHPDKTKDLGPGWRADPATGNIVHTDDNKGGDGQTGQETDGTSGDGQTAAGREGGEDASKARQELQSQTDGKILALINDVQQQNDLVKAQVKKLRDDIAEKWRSLGDQVTTPAGKKDFITYVDERIQQVRKLLTDANLLNESAAARARGAGKDYDPAGGTDQQGTGQGNNGDGNTGAGDTGGGDTGGGDTGGGDTGGDDPGAGDTTDPSETTTEDPVTTTQPTTTTPTTEQPQATQQQQQPMSMPTMSTPTMPDVSSLVPGLKSLIDQQNAKDDPSQTGDETDPTKVDPSDTTDDSSSKDDPSVVPEDSGDNSSDGKDSDGNDSGDGKDGDGKDSDPTKPEGADKPAADAAAKPDTSTTVTLPGDGGTVQASNPALAAAGRSVIGGQPIADAFKAQGISLPPAGSPITDPVSTSELKFGDVGQFKDHQILSLGGDKVLVNGQVQPLSSLSTDSGFLGFFRPGQTGVGDGTSALTPTAPAAVATGVGTGAGGGEAGAAPSTTATTTPAPAAAGVGG